MSASLVGSLIFTSWYGTDSASPCCARCIGRAPGCSSHPGSSCQTGWSPPSAAGARFDLRFDPLRFEFVGLQPDSSARPACRLRRVARCRSASRVMPASVSSPFGGEVVGEQRAPAFTLLPKPMRPRAIELLHAQQLGRVGACRLMAWRAVEHGVAQIRLVVDGDLGPIRFDRRRQQVAGRATPPVALQAWRKPTR